MKKKILILSANPINTYRLRLHEEVREIQEALQLSKKREAFQLISIGAVRLKDLRRALLNHNPEIVHFSGHGTGTDGLVLENDSGTMQLVSTESLTNLFKLLINKTKCVVLNACYSEIQADAIHQHINCVIGVKNTIEDNAAINFSKGFYDGIFAGRSYAEAFELGRNDIPESLNPIIKIREETPSQQNKRLRRLVLTGIIIISVFSATKFFVWVLPTKDIIVLLANFDGPDPQKYRLTEKVFEQLQAIPKKYSDVKIETLGKSIAELQGSQVAQNEGDKRKATIVIWGFYGNTGEKVPLSVHFEVLRPPNNQLDLQLVNKYVKILPLPNNQLDLREVLNKMDKVSSGLIQTPSVRELTSFTLQTRLSNKISFLTLFTVGLTRYTASDWDRAISSFSDALTRIEEHPIKELDQSIIYFFRGNAYSYSHKKDYRRAIADYNQALKLNPNLAEAYNNRGYSYLQLQNYKGAITDYSQAIKLEPKSAIAYTNRGTTYDSLAIRINLNDNFKEDKKAQAYFKLALDDSTQAIKLQADYAPAYLVRGNAYAGLNKYELAFDNFAQAIKLQPNDARAYLSRGDVRSQLPTPDYQGAIADYTQGIELQSNNTNAYLSRGYARLQLKNYEEAIVDYTQAINLQPDDAELYSVRAFVRSQLPKPDYQGAIADYSRTIKLQPFSVRAYLLRGGVYLLSKDYPQAIADYNQAIKLEPNNANTYLLRGAFYLLSKDYLQAIADYNQVIKLQPNNANAYLSRGIAKRELKNYQEAIADFNQVIKLQPNNVNAYLLGGDVRLQLPTPDYREAVADYTQVIKLERNNADPKVYYNRGIANRELKNYQEAIADFNQVIKLQPNNSNGYASLGNIYQIQGDYDAALSQYNQALTKNEKFLPAITNIGYIKYEKGDVEGAIQQWQTVVNTNSNLAEPQMAMAVAFYAKGEQQKGLNMAQAALRLDKSWANVEFLKKNLWGKRLVADAQKVLSQK